MGSSYYSPALTQEQIDARNYYTWDEDAYQANNTQGWVPKRVKNDKE